MKKLIVLLTLVLMVALTGCSVDETEDFEFETLEDTPMVLSKLGYADYLKLSNPVITITVEGIGEMKFQLFPDIAPNTVNSFIQYVQDGDYDDNEFHRVIDGFVIQGGELEDTCEIAGEMTLQNETNDLLHYAGVISMARVGTDMDSATSQFFIVESNTESLNGEYAGFGGLIDGYEVLDYIASLQVEDAETPIVPIIITSITVELNGYTPVDRVCYESDDEE